MTSVAMSDPVDPPMPITPSSFPSAKYSPAIRAAPAMVILVTRERSFDARISSMLLPPAAATLSGPISALVGPSPLMEISMSRGVIPRDSILSLR